jgi:Xaa-Pro aminopeptidase
VLFAPHAGFQAGDFMNDRIADSAIPEPAMFARRIESLRGQMALEKLAAVLIPSADPHLSE